MKRPLIYSAFLHLTVLALLLIGFYNPFERKRQTETPMMIEFVHVAEQSAAPVLAPEVIKEVEQPAPPKPSPAPPQPNPTPPLPEPAPQPEPEPVKPEPPKPEEPKPVDAEPIPDPKAREKPKEKPKEKKPEKQKVDITLDKKKKSTPKVDEKKDKKKKPSKPSKTLDDIMNEVENENESNNDDGAPSRGKGAPAATIGPVLTASEKDALSRHMQRCWIIPAALRGEKDLRVPIKLNVARDGTVQKAEIQDKGRMGRDPAYRTAAESARRAVLDPNCSPLPIPQDKYEMFKEFVFNFDPKEVLN